MSKKIFVILLIYSVSCEHTVFIRPIGNAKYFDLPTSKEPAVAWMDIQKGIFPNTSQIVSEITVGEPITIFIYLKDKSNLYDVKVTDCWAYDTDNIADSKYKLHLTEEHKKRGKIIEKWDKFQIPPGHGLKTVLYTQLESFKFPDHDQIHMTCDVELCFKSCDQSSKINTT